MFVESSSNESMIGFDKHCAREEFAERIDGRPPDCDSRKQKREAQPPDKARSAMDAANAGKAKNHSNRLDKVGDIPEFRRMFVPILSWLDSIATQIWVFDKNPHESNYGCKNRKQHTSVDPVRMDPDISRSDYE